MLEDMKFALRAFDYSTILALYVCMREVIADNRVLLLRELVKTRRSCALP